MLKLTFLVFQEMFNPFFHKENDGHHWILKMMTFHRNEWNAIQRDWCTNVIVLGLCHQHFLKASGMPFVRTFDQRNSRKETDDWFFQPLSQIADIKMQCFHASKNSMTQFAFPFLDCREAFQLHKIQCILMK